MTTQINSTAQKIYDTAIEVAQTSKCFQNNRFGSFFSKGSPDDLLESIIDMLGSSNNLVVALGAKSIKYNKDDLKYALSISKQESKNSKGNYEKIIEDFSKQQLMFLLRGRYRFVIAMVPLICLLCYILILEIFQLDKALIYIPMAALLFAIINLIIYYTKLTTIWGKYSIVMSSMYLIESLISRQP